MTRLVLIAGVARNGAIGKEDALPWRLPEDLKHFKQHTLGWPVVMGRRTWESLPPAFRPLPGRRNLVVTRQADWRSDGAEPAPSLDAALQRVQQSERAFVIGGAQLYAEALPRADELLLTEIDADFEADAFFPAWDRSAFVERSRETHRAAAGWDFAFVHYARRPA
jgi:dihydrofolate reductase